MRTQAFRHQQLDRLADQFVATVTVQGLCLVIHAGNAPARVQREHGDRRGFERLGKLPFQTLARADVDDHGQGEDSCSESDRLEHDLHRHAGAVPPARQ